MKISKEIEGIGTVRYEETFWLGRKSLYLDGVMMTKLSKKEFGYTKDGTSMKFSLEGNFFRGVSLVINGARHELVQKTAWYEYIAAFIGFIFILVWGNVPALCELMPLVGGAIGGLIGGVGIVLGIYSMRASKKPIVRILIGLAASGISILICYLIGFAIVSAAS